jgi:nitroreductase
MLKDELNNAIEISQHVQRNWDLSKTMPDEDIELIAKATVQAPSKQNIVFFKPYFITNRTIIEAIHRLTSGFHISDGNHGAVGNKLTTNPQTLANLLIVFAKDFDKEDALTKTDISHEAELMDTDMHQAIGIAAGYTNITSTLLGYSTGYCGCMNADEIQRVLKIEHKPVLLMGVGFADENRHRREHHLFPNLMFPAKPKDITVEYIS